MLKDLFNLIFPNECPGCGQELVSGEKGVCLACLNDMEQTGFEKKPLDNELFLRFAGLADIQGAAALWYFDKKGKLQHIIGALKYGNQTGVGQYIGEYYGQILKDSGFVSPEDVLIPVPLHKSRQRERGFNQSEEITKGLSISLGIPYNTTAFIRHAKTPTQTKKSREERYKNVESVFSLKEPLTQPVILIDDVITTGSTLISCIASLREAENGPESIKVLSIGVTRKE